MKQLLYNNEQILVKFSYSEVLLNVFKATIPSSGRKAIYDYRGKFLHWIVYPIHLEKLLHFGKTYGFAIDKKLFKIDPRVIGKINIRIDFNEDEFVFSVYNAGFIKEEFDRIPNIKWDGKEYKVKADNYIFVQMFIDRMKKHFQNVNLTVTSNAFNAINNPTTSKIQKIELRRQNVKKYLKNYKFKEKPFKHQIENIVEVIANEDFLNNDETGAAKSYPTLCIIDIYLKKGMEKALIITPNSVKYNWLTEEIMTRFPEYYESKQVSLYDSSCTKKNAKKYLQGTIVKNVDLAMNKKILIINQESVAKNKLKLMNFLGDKGILIIDEVQCIKNPGAKITQSVMGLRNKNGISHCAKRKIILTGTLIADKPIDAYIPIKLIGGEVPDSFVEFKRLYCDYQGAVLKRYKNLDVLKEIIKQKSIRHLKKDCLDLPPKIYQNIFVDLEPEQKALYEKMKKHLYIEIFKKGGLYKLKAGIILVKLLRLKQLASNPILLTDGYDGRKACKVKYLDKALNDLLYQDNKAIIWTEHRANVDFLVNHYKKYNPAHIIGTELDGKTMKPFERHEQVLRFQNDSKCKLIVCSYAGKAGINLTRGNYSFYFDRDMTLIKMTQSQDRFHRPGQTKECHIIKLIAKNTIDELIEHKLGDKMDKANYLHGDEMEDTMFKLTEREIKELLST
jgi:hypothetical protein